MSETTGTVEEVVPLNLKAILDWCERFRPDLRPVVWAERNNGGFVMMMTMGFEAGRHFQKDNPDFSMEASNLYLERAEVMKE